MRINLGRLLFKSKLLNKNLRRRVSSPVGRGRAKRVMIYLCVYFILFFPGCEGRSRSIYEIYFCFQYDQQENLREFFYVACNK